MLFIRYQNFYIKHETLETQIKKLKMEFTFIFLIFFFCPKNMIAFSLLATIIYDLKSKQIRAICLFTRLLKF